MTLQEQFRMFVSDSTSSVVYQAKIEECKQRLRDLESRKEEWLFNDQLNFWKVEESLAMLQRALRVSMALEAGDIRGAMKMSGGFRDWEIDKILGVSVPADACV